VLRRRDEIIGVDNAGGRHDRRAAAWPPRQPGQRPPRPRRTAACVAVCGPPRACPSGSPIT
jgi:hypothetical protein